MTEFTDKQECQGEAQPSTEPRANITLEELAGCECSDPECPRKQPKTHQLQPFAYVLLTISLDADGEPEGSSLADGTGLDLVNLGCVFMQHLSDAGLLHTVLMASGVLQPVGVAVRRSSEPPPPADPPET
jgi:hypothetical protein